MPDLGKLQQTVFQFRQQLLQKDATAEKTLTDAFLQALNAVQAKLSELYQQMDEMQQAGETIPASWLYESRRLAMIKQAITEQFDRYGSLAQQTVQQLQQYATGLGTAAAYNQLQHLSPGGNLGRPSPDALREFVGATQDGSPLADLFRGYGEQAADDVTKVFIAGLATGENPNRIASQVAERLQISRNKAMAIASTEMIRAYRGSNIATFQANKRICPKWRWTCALSKRTCAACIAMDGTLHDVEEQMGSHTRCRCVPMPITSSYADILEPLGISSAHTQPTQPELPTGMDWFHKQDPATQKAVLGEAKYQAWKKGQFQFSDIVAHAHDPQWGKSIREKSLKELVKA